MKNLMLILSVAFLLISCAEEETSTELEEMGQQMGDVMASVDASGGNSSGTYASITHFNNRTFARLNRPDFVQKLQRTLFPSATAASCLATDTFGDCTDNGDTETIVRDFQDCTILGATFSGAVTLTFDDGTADGAACTFSTSGDTVTRDPDYTVTGLRGATLAVSKTGSLGQRLTRTNTTDQFEFSNDGIRRLFTSSDGGTVLDFTNETTSVITITGSSRNGRVMDGGALQVTNNSSGQVCSYSPSDVTWTDDCNCATSGTWTGTCDSGATSTELEITGCGSGTLTLGDESTDITFDRCFDL